MEREETRAQDQVNVMLRIWQLVPESVAPDSEAESLTVQFGKVILAATCKVDESQRLEVQDQVGSGNWDETLEQEHNSAKFFDTW